MSVKVSMKVNGKAVSAEVEERTLLVTFIREHLLLAAELHIGLIEQPLPAGKDEILAHAHALAMEALERPDTS